MVRTEYAALIEMNKSLIADNNYLRSELRAARERMARQGEAPERGHEGQGVPPIRAQAEYGGGELPGQVVGVLPSVQGGRSALEGARYTIPTKWATCATSGPDVST